MSFELKKWLRWDASRRDGKALLRLPHLDEVRSPRFQDKVNRELTDCAKVIAAKQLLYRWREKIVRHRC